MNISLALALQLAPNRDVAAAIMADAKEQLAHREISPAEYDSGLVVWGDLYAAHYAYVCYGYNFDGDNASDNIIRTLYQDYGEDYIEFITRVSEAADAMRPLYEVSSSNAKLYSAIHDNPRVA